MPKKERARVDLSGNGGVKVGGLEVRVYYEEGETLRTEGDGVKRRKMRREYRIEGYLARGKYRGMRKFRFWVDAGEFDEAMESLKALYVGNN